MGHWVFLMVLKYPHPFAFEDTNFSTDSRRLWDLNFTCWNNQEKIVWFCSVDYKSQLLITWNLIITEKIFGFSVFVLYWIFCGYKLPFDLFLKTTIKFNCALQRKSEISETLYSLSVIHPENLLCKWWQTMLVNREGTIFQCWCGLFSNLLCEDEHTALSSMEMVPLQLVGWF